MSAALFVRAVFWLWFGGAVAASHWLVLRRLPPVAVPLFVVLISGALVLILFRVAALRAWLEAMDLRALVLLHVSRLLGIYFLILHRDGEIPRAFAVTAGAAEIAIAVMALPVVFAPLEPAARLRAIRIWSIVGLVTLLLIVFTILRLNLSTPWQLHLLPAAPAHRAIGRGHS
jgi:hypothetical protein